VRQKKQLQTSTHPLAQHQTADINLVSTIAAATPIVVPTIASFIPSLTSASEGRMYTKKRFEKFALLLR